MDLPWQLYVFAFLVSTQLFKLRRQYERRKALSEIPAVGPSGVLRSYKTVWRYIRDARSVLQEGYQKSNGGLFRVPQISGWFVITAGRHLEDLRTAPDSQLSLDAAGAELLQSDYTMGKDIRLDTYHLGVLRNVMTKKLPTMLLDMADEIRFSFNDLIDRKFTDSPNEWAHIRASEVFTIFVARITNRSFVGLPLCRNDDYCNINIYFAHHVMFGSAVINCFPNFLKPLVGAVYNKISGLRTRIVVHLRPLIEQRQREKAAGEQRSDDMLTWLMDAAPPGHQSVEAISERLLNVNFMALHTTAMTFTHALFHLAARPEYIGWLRDEIKENLGTEWIDSPNVLDKEKIEKCWKLDSFLKECGRLNGLGAFSLPRKSLVPFRFSDGSIIPAGTIVAAAPTATHLDNTLFENAAEFDGFRFYKQRREAEARYGAASAEEVKCRLTSPSAGYLAFGGGRHTCPGRFLASLEIKLMLAYLILQYDVRTEEEGVRPPDFWFGPVCTPSQSAAVLFRRRAKL
ncbi:hypothetical protein D9615_002741 [Tricholomella constricta]|uniref:Cytochrome P450 n=1 Tax=Tricholomella constricta TaxID=117010 RepID=A0A8H5M621_9AGAR|nr:hypothetical protein D9615_002741 [Tricholomella constricta]